MIVFVIAFESFGARTLNQCEKRSPGMGLLSRIDSFFFKKKKVQLGAKKGCPELMYSSLFLAQPLMLTFPHENKKHFNRIKNIDE